MAARHSRSRRLWRHLFAPTLILLALALPWYATAEPGPAQPAPAQSAALRPALIVVPAEDGQSVLVQAGGVGQLSGQVFTNLRIGPTGNKGSYTMTYSDTIASYVTNVAGFAPINTESAGLSITTTAGLDSGELTFTRALLGQVGDLLTTDDGGLSVEIINPGTFAGDTYLAATPSFAPPGPPPPGRKLAGRAYSLRAAGAIAVADQPLALQLTYSPQALTEAEVAALEIYAWDPFARRWDAVGGTVFPNQAYVSAPIVRFTFYALMTTGFYTVHLPVVIR